MAGYNRFDPFHDVLSLQDSLVRAFGAAYGKRPEAAAQKETATYSFTPAVDVFEDADGLHIYAELPGVPLKDIDVRVEANTLTLHGERRLENDNAQQGYRLVERSFGAFHRTFTLPETVDAEQVSAEAQDGVLRIRLPKKAESKPRQIKVQVGSPATLTGPSTKQ